MAWEHGRVRFFDGKLSAPETGDDENSGFRVSDVWIDEAGEKAYRCLDASAGAAIWQENGDVAGPGSSLDNEVPLFDGTSGKVIKDGSGLSISSGLMQAENKALLLAGATGAIPTSGAGTRMMWIPGKVAFRAGQVIADEWDDGNIGTLSFAFGYKVKASNYYSICFGKNGLANGNSSSCFGVDGISSGYASLHFGNNGQASSTFSTHFGFNGQASNLASIHFGGSGKASGMYSTHFGDSGEAAGTNSIVCGKHMCLSSAAANSFAWGHHSSLVTLTQPNTFYIFPSGTAGRVALGVTEPTAMLDIGSDTIRLRTSKTPANSGDVGNTGDECWDADFHYRCVLTNTWKRSALSTW